jgi:hypothetical protein
LHHRGGPAVPVEEHCQSKQAKQQRTPLSRTAGVPGGPGMAAWWHGGFTHTREVCC